MTLTFEILGKPQPRGSKRAFIRPGMRHPVITDDNRKSKPWMQEVAAVAREAMNGNGLIDGPVVMYVNFYFCRPKGHFGKKGLRASAPKAHVVKPDCTKVLRCLEDALKGVVWRDDSQVTEQHVTKGYGEYEHTKVTIIEETTDA